MGVGRVGERRRGGAGAENVLHHERLDARHVEPAHGLRAPELGKLVERRVPLQHQGDVVTAGKGHDARRSLAAQLCQALDAVGAGCHAAHVEPLAPRRNQLRGIPARAEDDAVGRQNHEPGIRGGHDEGEHPIGPRVLPRVGDRRLVAVVAVGDVERVARGGGCEALRFIVGHDPEPHRDTVEFGSRRRRAPGHRGQRRRERTVGIGSEEKDRLEVGARRPQQREAIGLGRGVRLLMRPHPPRLELLRPHRRQHPDPRAALPARQGEVLGNRVHGVGGVGAEHSFLAPRRELARRPQVAILSRRRFREGEVHDIVRVPRGQLRALFRRQHVVGGREQRAQARRRGEALAPERRRERRQVGVHHGGDSPCP